MKNQLTFMTIDSENFSSLSGNRQDTFLQLRRQSWWPAVVLFLAWLSGTALCRPLFKDNPAAIAFLSVGFLVACHLQRTLRHHLADNHRPGEAGLLFPTLGAANWITVLRAGAVVALAGFLPLTIYGFQGLPESLVWAPGLVYLGISAADLLDGIVARKLQRTTELGKKLDIETDAAGLMTASLLAVSLDRLPVAYLLAGFAYYVFILGIRVRQKLNKPVASLQQRPYARIIAGFQMCLVGLALLPIFNPVFSRIAGLIIMTPLLFGFFRDWLVVSCRLRTDGGRQSVMDQWAGSTVMKALPLLLRVALLAGGCALFVADSVQEPLRAWQLTCIFCSLLAGIGFLGRSASLLLVVLLAGSHSPFGMSSLSLAMFGAAVTLMLTGSGSLSIWAPEEKILYRGDQNGPETDRDSL
jgi:CDP-diacylglycerol--glycerol-3-phosphate 3-phosphatidyltransferase